MAHASKSGHAQLKDISTENRIVWLLYDPQHISLQSSETYTARLSDRLKYCDSQSVAEDLVIAVHIDRRYPCDLVTAADPFEVYYDNGIRLKNVLRIVDDSRLELDLWWGDEPAPRFAYSIQVVDPGGERVGQFDDVIRAEPLAQHVLDLTDLPPGDYRADLIVYHSESGKSLAGTVLRTGHSFQRALEIARFSLRE